MNEPRGPQPDDLETFGTLRPGPPLQSTPADLGAHTGNLTPGLRSTETLPQASCTFPQPSTDEEVRDSVDSGGPTAQDPVPGQILFGRYRVDRKLGEGGMGAVWLVHHLGLQSPRALKLIRPELAADPTVRARFQREGRVLARLAHPAAVLVHNAGVEGDVLFIEMEYLPGRSIDQLLTRGKPMPLDWVMAILNQLCEVLQEAHDRGIVHRDLKPQNLMVVGEAGESAPKLKVLDFGIAKLLAESGLTTEESQPTRTEARAFTPMYASPEQILGEAIDPRSDLYSVGVILYELLTGHRPFRGRNLFSEKLVNPSPPFAARNANVQLPTALERVVLRCLSRDLDERPRSASELLQEFRAAISTLEQGRGSRFTVGTLPWRRCLAAVATLGAGAILAALAMPILRPHPPVLPAGYVVPPGTVWIGELPGTVLCTATGVRFHRVNGGLYCPDGYDAESARGRAETWPLAIRSKSDGRRYVRVQPGVYVPDGFRVAEEGTRPGVQPRTLVRAADGGRFVLANETTYIPEGYAADLSGQPPVRGQTPAAIVRLSDGVRFVWLAGGSFAMGSPGPPSGQSSDDEDRPAHQVHVAGFYLQEHEVTNAEVERYFNAEKLNPADEEVFQIAVQNLLRARKAEEAPLHPAVGLTHDTAERFAAWAHGRLPTEAEWEFAARSRGRSDRPFVWGEVPLSAVDLRGRLVNVDYAGGDLVPTRPVMQSPRDRTDQAVFDLAGNVREWCGDVFRPYPGASGSEATAAPAEAGPPEYVVRGGSYRTFVDNTRTTRPRRLTRDDTDEQGQKRPAASDLGLRLVIEPIPVAGTAIQ